MSDDEETSVAESMLAKSKDDAEQKDEQLPARERFGKFKVPPDRHISGITEMKATDSE